MAHASHNLFLARMVESLVECLAASEPRPAEPTAAMADTPLLPVGYEAHARIYRPLRGRRVGAARRAMHEHLSMTICHHPGLAD